MPAYAKAAALLIACALVGACSRDAPPPPAQAPDVPRPQALRDLDPDAVESVADAITAVESALDDAGRWLRLGMLYDVQGRDDLAEACYLRGLAVDADLDKARYYLAVLKHRRGELTEAVTQMARVAQRRPDFAPAQWRLGMWLLNQGDLDGAEAAAGRADDIDTTDPGGRYLAARVALQRGDATGAVAILEPLIAARSDDLYGHFLLGTAYRQSGHLEEAREHLRRGQGAGLQLDDPWMTELSEKRTGFRIRFQEARTALGSADPDEAIGRFEALRAERPDNIEGLTNLGIAYRVAGRSDDAIAVLEDAVHRNPYHDTARFQLAGALRQQHDEQKLPPDSDLLGRALLHADRVIELSPTWAAAHGMRGEILARRALVDEAVGSMLDAQRLEPDNPTWPLRAGTFLVSARRWDEAVVYLESASRLDPDSADALVFLASAHANAGRLSDALIAIRHASVIAPSDPRVVAALQQVTRAIKARGDRPQAGSDG